MFGTTLRRWQRWLAGGLLCTLVAAGIAGWLGRDGLRTWYYLHTLARAAEGDLPRCSDQVRGLGDAVVPTLVQALAQPDALACQNFATCLQAFVASWPAEDERRTGLAERLVESYAASSIPGRQATLRVASQLGIGAASDDRRSSALCRLLQGASQDVDETVHAEALDLASALLDQFSTPDLLHACGQLAQKCLRDSNADQRVRAVRLAARPGIELLEPLVGLLNDPSAEVRRSVILAVGGAESAVATDDLLPWLHDPDADVRRLCEKALLGRGLRDEHLQLGRLMTDRRAESRLEVLDLLQKTADLEPSIWLRRLSHDPVAAVRAAAVRAAGEQPGVHLEDRLDQMAANDPSATVRQLARFYRGNQPPKAADPPGVEHR